jgi:plasmid stabilization system protein ParE
LSAYRLSDEAKTDILGIRAYLEEHFGRDRAVEVLLKINEAFRFIGKNPRAGHLREDLTPLPLRFWLVYPYLIVYSTAHHPLRVLRVLRSSPDMASILNPE